MACNAQLFSFNVFFYNLSQFHKIEETFDQILRSTSLHYRKQLLNIAESNFKFVS